jgi:hypothetical protein
MMHVFTSELVLDAGELLELSMECVCVDKMGFLELRTPKLLYLEMNKCYLGAVRVSAPGLREITY